MATPVATATLFFSLLNSAAAHPLTKRGNDYAIPQALIILLIMLGSGLLVCMGFAIHATFGFRRNGNGIKPMSAEQKEYMTEVRVRNMNGLMAEGARSHKGGLKRGDVVYD